MMMMMMIPNSAVMASSTILQTFECVCVCVCVYVCGVREREREKNCNQAKFSDNSTMNYKLEPFIPFY